MSLKDKILVPFRTLKEFNPNTRSCVVLEPLWGIPFNLYITYASLYMLALGLTNKEIGLVSAAGLTFQMIFALTGGFITDRLGRRLTSLIFDITAWTLPTLIWAAAQNIHYFMIAAILNATVRIVQNSWNCLMIEDAKAEERVHIYSWVEIANILAGFFAPFAGWLILRFSLVPTVRALYLFAFVSMTTMILTRHKLTTETRTGLIKIEESKRYTVSRTFRQYPVAIRLLVTNPAALVAFILVLLNNIHIQLKNIFLGIILNRGIGLPQADLAVFPAVTSAIVLFIYIFIMPSLGRGDPKKPLLFGFIVLILSYGILLAAPHGSFLFAMISTIIGAAGYAVVTPFINSYFANQVDDNHRAKTMSIVYAVIYGGTAPFSYLAGMMSALNPRFTAALLLFVFLSGIGCLGILKKLEKLEKKTGSDVLS